MSSEEASDKEHQRRLRILQGLFAKTKENGATEEESSAAMEHATKLMNDWAIKDYELGEVFERKTFVKRILVLKYANKWRWLIANQLAWNTGVYALHHWLGRKEWIEFHGREQHVEAAAILTEFIIGAIEELSSEFAKRTGTGSTGRRRFARGCSDRVRQRIHSSYNLTADPRLPVIMKETREEAKLALNDDTVKTRRSQQREEDTPEYILGFLKGDDVKLRKQTEQLTND